MAPEAKKQKLDAAAPRSVPSAWLSSDSLGSSRSAWPRFSAALALASWKDSEGSQSQSKRPMRSAARCSAASSGMPLAR